MERYNMVKVLGKGSFGSAWLVERKSDLEPLVAKETKMANMQKQDLRTALNEVAILRTLNHPNIIQYVDHFEYNNSLYIVMEYANGGDLHAKLKARKGQLLSEQEVLHYFSQICLAIACMHERRILHRDLKTHNVFLTKDGVVKLGDFGISTVLRNTFELKKTVCGTPYYFSPELCLNRPYNNKSDIWALGCILYEMLTLNHAFGGSNMQSLVQKILKGTYPPIDNSYSSHLSRLVSQMLQNDPHLRPNASQIISLPFIQEALANLQRGVQVAKLTNAPVTLPAVKPSAVQNIRKNEEWQQEELRRQRELLLREFTHVAKYATISLDDFKKLSPHEQARVIRTAREIKHAEGNAKWAKKNAELVNKRREEMWDKNLQSIVPQEYVVTPPTTTASAAAEVETNNNEQKQQIPEREGKISNNKSNTQEITAADVYREVRQQTKANKRRLYAELGQPLPPTPVRRNDQAPQPPSTPPMYPHINNNNNNESENNVNQVKVIHGHVLSPPSPAAIAGNAAQLSSLPLSQPPRPASHNVATNSNNNNINTKNEDNIMCSAPPFPSRWAGNEYMPRQMTQAELDEARRIAFWEMRQAAAKNKERIKESTLIKKRNSGGNDAPNANNNERNSNNANSVNENNVSRLHASEKENAKESKKLNTSSSSNKKVQGNEAIIRNPRPPTSTKPRLTPMNANDIAKRTNKKENTKIISSKTHNKRVKELQESKHRVGQMNSQNSNTQDQQNKEYEVNEVDEMKEDEDDDNEDEEVDLEEFISQELANENNNAHDGETSVEQVARRQVEYGALDGAIQAALNARPKSDNDDFDDVAFHDDADPTRFVLDGKTLELPHFNAGNPLMHRIESLRVFLEYNMGEDALMMCYRAMNNISAEDDSAMQKIAQTLPKECQRFIPLVAQLIVCEDTFNRQGGE